ncbi:MAG: hypothetical protein EBR40_11970, partial [Proteobacteria bacterium]|nr:hypothetical protein [Pseudomonadota bacterium]
GGWTAGKQQAEAASDYAQTFKPAPKTQIIKFLEDAPYVNFRRHWVERNGANGVSKRPYTCPQTFGKRCPLCDVGDKAQAVSSFNVALIGDDGVPSLRSWDVGVKLFNVLEDYHNDPKIGPLTRGYFAVQQSSGGTGSKKGGTTQTNIVPVKPTSLLEDWSVHPPSNAELEAVGLYEPDVVSLPKRGELEEIAEELSSSGY